MEHGLGIGVTRFFSVKDQIVNPLGFAGDFVSTANIKLCCCSYIQLYFTSKNMAGQIWLRTRVCSLPGLDFRKC